LIPPVARLPAHALDPAQSLDVDVDELARPPVLVAERPLEPEPAQASEPKPGQDPGHGRERDRERLGDLGGGEAQAPQ
jgi:hypothetical protein